MNELSQRVASLSPAKRQLLQEQLKRKPDLAEPIAVVGMACRFPGAGNLQDYWRLIRDGVEAIGPIPSDRWDAEAFYDPDFDAVGKMATRWGAFLRDPDRFDPLFFGIAPREASKMDPQQRLLLEVSYEALENALLPLEAVAGSATGVFIGIGGSDYSKLPSQFEDYYQQIDAHVGTGNALSIAANRISYALDLHGPSMAVDTACSSALVGVHVAVQSLRARECDAALAGGVNMIISPEVTIAFSKARMLSPTGQCHPFDASANGYVRGEGCGIVVLKRLTDAMGAGDNVLAVLRASAVNQDGRTSGITAPNSRSQVAVIRAALAQAGLTPERVTYVEAHGTGTPLGDPIEMQALTELFKRRNDEELPCYVSSVKANVGHMETASGMAGMIKVMLMMRHGMVPAQLHLSELNQHIHLEGSRIVIPRQAVPWETGGAPRIAGVSSFGFGGTNAHVILEQAAAPTADDEQPAGAPRILALSAKSEPALQILARRYAEFLDDNPQATLAEICQSANSGRSHFNHRLAIVAEDRAEMRQKLAAAADELSAPAVRSGHVKAATRPKLAMLFTGQGSQYVGMGRGLYDSQPVFREALDRCDDVLAELVDVRLLDMLYPHAGHRSPLDETAYTQPALFAIEYALAELWRSWGIKPDLLLGHSIGEYVAACVAGVLSLDDALRLVAERARLMQSLPHDGLMAVVFAPLERVDAALAPFRASVAVAAANGPENTVISGDADAVHELVAQFERSGIGSQLLSVSHAFHSPLMEPILDEFTELAASVDYSAPRVPLVANLTGQVTLEAPDAGYWRRHLRSTVRFADSIERLAEADIDVLLEVGPTASLLGMGKRVIPQHKAAWLASLRKGQNDERVLASTLGELYLAGVKIDWRGVDRQRRRKLLLPNYPFERSRHWFDLKARPRFVSAAASGPVLHPLLGTRVHAAVESTLFQGRLSPREPAYLADHQVQGSVVVPGAAYAEMGLAAAAQLFGEVDHGVENLSIQQAMFLPEGANRTVQLTVAREQEGQCTFQVFSAPTTGDGEQVSWTLHACGNLRRRETSATSSELQPIDVADVERRVIDISSHESFYERIAARGLNYGEQFRVLHNLLRTGEAALGDVCLPARTAAECDMYHLHPVLLDACLQATACVVPVETDGSYSPYTYMPTAIGRLRILGRPAGPLRVYARRTSPGNEPSPETVEADVVLIDPAGNVLVELTGVRIQRIGRGAKPTDETDLSRWLYRVSWRPQPLLNPAGMNGKLVGTGTLVVLADRTQVGQALAQRLEARGYRCVLVQCGEQFQNPLDAQTYRRLLDRVTGEHGPLIGVVHMGSLDAPEPSADGIDELETARRLGCGSVLELIRQLAARSAAKPPQLWLVTRGAQPVARHDERVAVAQSPLWGLGRVAAVEHPELRCRLVDLDPAESADALAEQLAAELLGGSVEPQVAFRAGCRHVARLEVCRDEPSGASGAESVGPLAVPAAGAFRLRIGTPGSFDSLWYESVSRREPDDGQVEIDVRAAGLNFSDVLKALGLYPGITDAVVPVGIECAGVVTAVGPGVERLRVGDEVLGVAPYSFASHAISAEYALAPKPADLSFAEAAALPIAFLTAHYALRRLADLQPGERVLIHAGAGGVGLAALQAARHAGAEVLATAGSDAKRDFLRSLGVEHVFSSRTLDFSDQIMGITGRRGVDVVLNSLPGEAIPKSLSILSAYGRFLEIGKTDIYQNRMIGLAPFQNNLSYFAIDLDRMLRQRPEYVRGLLAEVMELFHAGHYRPLPMTQFAAADTVQAFRYMAQRKNIGKVVISVADRPAEAERSTGNNGGAVRADGTYLITGGLGALGLKVARWLAAHGAQRLALMARSEPTAEAAAAVEELRTSGVQVALPRGDVARRESLAAALAQIPAEYPPLRGVIHAAGVLDDGVLFEMDQDRLARVMAPKVDGAWNLHQATLDRPLDFFVLFSSVACVLGSPGQGNYAAGNAFLDGLAALRRASGLPATSINWGPWADSGMATAGGNDARLSGRGMGLIPPERGLEALALTLASSPVQLAVVSARWGELARLVPGGAPPLLADVMPADDGGSKAAAADSGEDRQLRSKLLVVDGDERKRLLVGYFAEQLGRIMGMPAANIDVDQPLNTLGLDSLMAIELKNNIETRLRVVLPMARFMEGPSVAKLAEAVAAALADERADGAPLSAEATHAGGRQPLSAGQEALWFLHHLAPHSTAYNICDAVRVHGPLDEQALALALQAMTDRHAAFRTTFHDDDGQPYQQVHDSWPIGLTVHAARVWSEEQVRECVSAEIHKPFDLQAAPPLHLALLQLAADEHVLVFVVHHIVSDFWSLVICTDEFERLYAAIVSGGQCKLPELPLGYAGFTRWQREMLDGPAGAAHWEYWREQLQGELPALNLPTDRPRPPLQSFAGALTFRYLEPALAERIRQLAERHGATLQTLLLAAYQVLLQRYTGQDDIMVGVPTSGRTRAEFAPLIGYFVNPVVLRGDLSANPPFDQFVDQIRDRMLAALDHQDFPFPLLVQRLQPERDPSRSPLVQTMFVFQKAQVMHEQGLTPFLMGQSGAKLDFAGLTFESMTLEQWVAQFDLLLSAAEASGGISLGLQFNTDLFDRQTAERLLDHYRTLLESIVDDPACPVGRLEMLTPDQRRTLLVEWNRSQAPPPDERLVYQHVEEQAARRPEATAVVCGESRLSFGELNERSNRLAHWLRGRGVEPDVKVGICLGRCTDLLVAILGVMKAGGAYVPLDPAYPAQRLRDIALGADLSLVLTHASLTDRLADCQARVVLLDAQWPEIAQCNDQNPTPTASGSNLIYVIFTSGSTGKPKGAGVYHHGFANLTRWLIRRYGLSTQDRSLVITSHGFDLTQKNLLALLMVGGELHLSVDPLASTTPATLGPTLYDPVEIARQIEHAGITLLICTPSNMYALVADADERRFAQLDGLRLVQMAGEPLDLAPLAPWMSRPSFRTLISNAYGPTECTDLAACCDLDDPPAHLGRPVPIGRPLDNVKLYIVSKHGQPLPVGVPGELLIGGAGVGAGYVNDPQLTAARFLPDPFDPAPGQRVYRTGDVCRYLPDGQIEFLGRIDHQVKIRGFRIELGEIEACLKEQPGVREAVVVVREDSPGEKRVVGYAVPNAGCELSTADLVAAARRRLPEYMVPWSVVVLEALPLTPHGKVDRRSLPAPDTGRPELAVGYLAPRDELETRLARVWEELLGVRPVGVRDNFFQLGGHSLLAVRLVNRIQKTLGRELPLAALLQSATIESLARLLGQSSPTPSGSPLVPLSPDGDGPPLFLFHPVGGNVLCYAQLARELAGMPVYALKALGADGEQPPADSLGAMIDAYLEAIRGVQPAGPYRFAGWSTGGVLAYEAARRVREQGDAVELVALIDTRLPASLAAAPRDGLSILLEMADFLGRFSGADVRLERHELEAAPPESRLELAAERLRLSGLLPDGMDADRLDRFVALCQANWQAIADYRPAPADLPLCMFRAEVDRPRDGDDGPALGADLGWSAALGEAVPVEPIPGDHVTMIGGAGARRLAERIVARWRPTTGTTPATG